MKSRFVMVASLLIAVLTAAAQHEHHMPAKSDTTKHKEKLQRDTSQSRHDAKDSHMHDNEQGMQMNMDVPMSHSFSLNLPMSRNGSGTGWLPDESPMFGYMAHSKKWMYMIHGQVFLRYTRQDLADKGSRGDEVFDAPNWFMAMGQRKVGSKGLFHFNTMVSFDRITEGGNGYPLLFQSGESWEGNPLVDRQHPHDLFSELSVAYTQSFSKKSDLTFYLAYPGEPALGPVAFMHRPSAFPNPDAPISHHWVDATHITFGVATLGYRYDKFKLELSSFTGREPDEDRYAFDKPRFDSWSGRISFNPTRNWAFQVSQGWIKSPELLHEAEDVDRTTASAVYSRELGPEKNLNATATWGMNKTDNHDAEHSALLEGALKLNRVVLYARYEFVQKSVEELALDEDDYEQGVLFPVNALTLGTNYDLLNKRAHIAIGVQITGYHADERLDPLYGKNPLAGEVFLRFYPKLMNMKH